MTYFLLALGGSLALTPVCRAAAHRFGQVAAPEQDRWHRRPTALFGGVAIALPTLALALVGQGVPGTLWPVIGCGAAIAAVGFADDVLSLKPSTKLIAQVVVASALLFFGFRLHWTTSLVGDAMLTLFWIVGVTNALNLLDNMDGLCGGIALVAGFFLLAGLVHQPDGSAAAVYLVTLLGATTGFLAYNIHPATIFMGDTGSLFLGFNFAALTLVSRPEGHSRSDVLSAVAVPVLLLLIPIFDTSLVTAARLLSGRRPSQGGRDHSSHRLVAIGLSETRAVVTLCGLAAAGGVLSLLLRQPDRSGALIVAVLFVLAMIIFGVYLARIRVYAGRESAAVTVGRATPVVADFMYKRRVVEVLLDLCLIPLAYYAAYRLRFENSALALNYPLFLQSLPIVLASQLLALFVVGGYRGTWRRFGLMDTVVFGKGVVLGTAVAELVILYLFRFDAYSRSVFVIDGLLLLFLLTGTRGSFRLMGEFVQRRQATGRRAIIYGTGELLTTIRHAFGKLPLTIVGFVDDNPSAYHTRVDGYPVVGGYDALVRLVAARAVDSVVVSAPLPDGDRLRDLEERCRAANVELLRLHVSLSPLQTRPSSIGAVHAGEPPRSA